MCRWFLIQFLACNEGYFGTNCSHICLPNCQPGKCQHTDGSCTSCVEGWMGGNCTTGKYAHRLLLNRCKECQGNTLHLIKEKHFTKSKQKKKTVNIYRLHSKRSLGSKQHRTYNFISPVLIEALIEPFIRFVCLCLCYSLFAIWTAYDNICL